MKKIKEFLKKKILIIFVIILVAVSFLPIFEETEGFRCKPGVVYTGVGINAECPYVPKGVYVNFWQKIVFRQYK